MHILVSLKAEAQDRKQKGFAGDPGCRYTGIATAWASPYVGSTVTATLRADEELKLERETAKGQEQDVTTAGYGQLG